MTAPFATRELQVVFELESGVFEGGGNTYTATGLRVEAEIVFSGVPFIGWAEIAIYGLPLSVMNKLTTFGKQWLLRNQNGITVLAGDNINGLSVAFAGNIYTAFVDAASQPDVCLRIAGSPGAFQSVTTMAPISIKGTVNAADLIKQLAKAMNLGFENNGVNVQLQNPYYDSSPWQAMIEIASHANIDLGVINGVVAIQPRNTPRSIAAVLVSAETGMVGYPSFVSSGVNLTALWNPAVQWGGLINLQSILTPANGQWMIRKLSYSLHSVVPNGPWFMEIEAISTDIADFDPGDLGEDLIS